MGGIAGDISMSVGLWNGQMRLFRVHWAGRMALCGDGCRSGVGGGMWSNSLVPDQARGEIGGNGVYWRCLVQCVRVGWVVCHYLRVRNLL